MKKTRRRATHQVQNISLCENWKRKGQFIYQSFSNQMNRICWNFLGFVCLNVYACWWKLKLPFNSCWSRSVSREEPWTICFDEMKKQLKKYFQSSEVGYLIFLIFLRDLLLSFIFVMHAYIQKYIHTINTHIHTYMMHKQLLHPHIDR